MIIIIDSREQLPYKFDRHNVEVVSTTLPVGDYSLPGFEDRVAIERKSLEDMIGCLMGKNRERFERELSKLQFYDLAAVVVEASLSDVAEGKYRSNMNPQSALQSIVAFQIRYRVPFMWCGNRKAGEYMTCSLLSKYLYEIQKRYQAATKSQGVAVPQISSEPKGMKLLET